MVRTWTPLFGSYPHEESGMIVAAGGGDPDAIVAMVDDRFSDDESQF